MNKREMVIDLTSLLDVILIILFLVLMNQHNKQEESVAALEQQIQTLEQLQLPRTATEKAWYLSFQEDIGKLNIVYPDRQEGQAIYLMKEDRTRQEKSAAEDLQDWLLKEVNTVNQDVVMLVFTYDNATIYNREYRQVLNTINRLNQLTRKKIIYSEYLVENTKE